MAALADYEFKHVDLKSLLFRDVCGKTVKKSKKIPTNSRVETVYEGGGRGMLFLR